ncbi:response regulator [Motiliproteus sediminis]|uniref:response regulator n=1 Tax=Motiliproteus sediminis TaxID=1468178 RepID=UPI001AEF3935|nr:response regulator [Motiliproteus sediminis]
MEHNTPWRVLVVDDEEGIHGITRMIFRDYEFEGRPVELISALSGAQARDLLQQHDDICLALLDVVMESDDEGLRLVDHIRDTLGNRDMRLILRTGHPGFAPETDVIIRYDINDYLSKAELSASRLLTSVLVALRSYRDIVGARRQPQSDPAAPARADAALQPLLVPLLDSNQQRVARLRQLELNPMARDLLAQIDCNQHRLQALCLQGDMAASPVVALDPQQLLQQLLENWLPLSRQQQRLLDLRIEPELPTRLFAPADSLGALWNALLAHALSANNSLDQHWQLRYLEPGELLQLSISASGGGVPADPQQDRYRQHWQQQLRPACERLCQQSGGSFEVLADAPEQLLINASVGVRRHP